MSLLYKDYQNALHSAHCNSSPYCVCPLRCRLSSQLALVRLTIGRLVSLESDILASSPPQSRTVLSSSEDVISHSYGDRGAPRPAIGLPTQHRVCINSLPASLPTLMYRVGIAYLQLSTVGWTPIVSSLHSARLFTFCLALG